tara:strand:- start:387 stop:1214 length:828 start_codon:yes stop_codon:yes gene_type:complete
MTSFNDYAISVEDSQPLEIYEVTLSGTVYRWTSDESTVTVGANDFDPEPISRNAVEQGAGAESRNLILTVPSDNEFAAQYVSIVPGVAATLNVYRLQRQESPAFNTQALVFSGEVIDVKFTQDGLNADLVVRGIEGVLNENIPRKTYMSLCNHVLYDNGCGADPALFNVSGTVSGVVGNVITLVGASAKTNGYFNGGYVSRLSGTPDFRMITDHTGDELTVLLPFAETVVGLSLQAFAGCDHKIDGLCSTRFDNVIEFDGYAFVPNRNPFDGIEV